MSNWMIDVEPRFRTRPGMGGRLMSRSSLVRALCGFSVLAAFGMLMAFIGVNALLGCETWDQSLWTASNSCVTPAMVVDGILGR